MLTRNISLSLCTAQHYHTNTVPEVHYKAEDDTHDGRTDLCKQKNNHI